MSSLGSPNSFFLAGKKAYEVERSLRFNDDDSAYLDRTFGSASNRKTFTISAWIKLGNLGTVNPIFSRYTANSDAGFLGLYVNSNDNLYFTGWSTIYFQTNRLFRDPSAWYHIVFAMDTTQSTNTDRWKLYINGTQETSFASTSYPSQDADLAINEAVAHMVGKYSTNLFDGYIAELNFIDGLALTPASFGATDVITGQWNPKKYTGSYGTNGFYLNFSDNSGTTATTLGKDSSGNGNNFTPNNFGTGDSVKDSPTNNFCTLNVNQGVYSSTGTNTYSEGNLKVSTPSSGTGAVAGTFGFTSGKWYAEVYVVANTGLNRVSVGATGRRIDTIRNAGNWGEISGSGDVAYLGQAGYSYVNGSYNTSYGSSYTVGDIVGVALDLDNRTINFYKNNTAQGNISIGSTGDWVIGTSDTSGGAGSTVVMNFGQDSSFAGNKTAQGNADGNGKGDFYYSPPSGFVAMCSANIPNPTILLPNKHFGTILYTGNGSSQTISDSNAVNFKPDWIWFKKRSGAESHHLSDSIRGANKRLVSNTAAAETTDNNLTSFNNNGFTISNSSGGSTNDNSATYAAWNWDAGETDGKTYTVTVVSDSGNKYRFDGFGTSAVTLDLAEGGTYIFNYPSAHPLKFSTTADGTHGGGSEYTTGVTHNTSTQVTIVVAASAPTLYYYCGSHSGMGGAVNTNSTLGSSNFDGTIQTITKVNATAGFSIITWTGTGSAGTIGHGLGVAPKWFVVKLRSGSQDWFVNNGMILNDLGKYYKLNSSGSSNASDTNVFPNTAPTSTVFSIGTDGAVNASGSTYVAYVFSEVEGYSKFTAYTGNGSTNGTFVYTGFTPTFMIQRKSSDENWHMMDTTRDPLNANTLGLDPNLSNAEANDSNLSIDFLSNGFKLRTSHSTANGSGTKYILLAFAEAPFKNSRAR